MCLHQRIAAGRLTAKGLEDHHLERAGKQIARIGFHDSLVHYRHRLNKYEEIVKADFTMSVEKHSVNVVRTISTQK
jgi:hypothetical protein